MKSTNATLSLMVLVLAFVLALGFIAGNTLAAGGKKVDITGKVEQGKIVADNGKEYIVADNAKSQELMSKHMCHQVEVKGTVAEKDGKETITISSFKHLAEGKC
jgi:hypothetical protein